MSESSFFDMPRRAALLRGREVQVLEVRGAGAGPSLARPRQRELPFEGCFLQKFCDRPKGIDRSLAPRGRGWGEG